MNQLEEIAPGITEFWHAYGYQVLIGGMAVLFGFIVLSLIISWARGKVDGWVVVVTWIGVFGFSAEGMWVVTTQKAQVPPLVALAVFFVAEGLQITSMRASRRHYIRTTIRGPETEDGKPGPIITAGDPGKHARSVWLIAIVAGVIVASSAKNVPEGLLRFAIPMGAAMLWWNLLTDEGTSRSKSRWRWTPGRILEAVGALEPADEERNLSEALRERHIRAMVTYGDRVRDRAWPLGYHKWRLRRLGRVADEEMVAEARRRLERTADILALVIPGHDTGQSGARSVTGQSTGRLTGQAAVTNAVGQAVSQTGRLISHPAVAQLTDRPATDGDRLPRLTAVTGQAGDAATDQSTGAGQSTTTELFPTDYAGLAARLRQMIAEGAVKTDPADGTVTVADAVRVFSPPNGPQCGRDKARKILEQEGLYRKPASERGVVYRIPKDEADEIQQVNGKVPDLAG